MSNKWPWDHVYVLNLDKEKKKWIKMKKQLKKLNIKAERFSAVYGLEKFPFGNEIKNAKKKYDKWIEISCGDGYSLLVCDVLNKNNKSIINKIKSGERFFTPLKKLFDSKSERTRFGIKGFYRS